MCGVFGIRNHPEAANLTYLGLHALQHRGQESAGVVSNHGGVLHGVRRVGQVRKIFSRDLLAQLRGSLAIGHVRYATSGGSAVKNIQPLWAQTHDSAMAVAHNGNLVNDDELRVELEREGAIFSSFSDTEVVVQLIARSRAPTFVERLIEALGQVRGAYSMVITTEDKLIAVRDPHGIRPLILGKLTNVDNCWVVASETCAFDLIEAERVRDLEPGEVLVIDDNGLTSHRLTPSQRKFCVFEHVYFSRPDSVLDGLSVYEARIAMGESLAVEHPADADAVIPVPDSGVVAAMGYARRSGIPFEMGLIRNHYVGRTFIEPMDSIRHFGVKLKLNVVPGLLRGKRVVVVDDSIVRGTTSRKIVRLLRAAGAKEVHVRISSPPVSGPCHYGIDTPTRAELVASAKPLEAIQQIIEADSLGYLSAAGLSEAVQARPGYSYCDACFTGQYPISISGTGRTRPQRLIEV